MIGLLLPVLLHLQAGNSRSLKQLAKAFLGINIQQQQQQQRQKPQQQHMESTLRHKQYKASAARKGQQQQRQQQQVVHREQHDPEEDAAAVMQLYQQVGTQRRHDSPAHARVQHYSALRWHT
jgi:hypothetical protein